MKLNIPTYFLRVHKNSGGDVPLLLVEKTSLALENNPMFGYHIR